MFKSNFEDITVADLFAVLKDECPQLKLDIECFMNELSKEEELMSSTLEDVLTSYDGELYREAYYGNEEPIFTGMLFYRELIYAVKERFPNEQWRMIGDYQISVKDHENREKWMVYEDERRIAQFASKGDKILIEVEYRYMSNHKADGVEVLKMKKIRG